MSLTARAIMPWVFCGFMVIIFISGAIGLFIGYNVAENRFAEDKLALVATQTKALAERDRLRVVAEERNARLETQFLAQVDELSENYKLLATELREELKSEIYTQCRVPLSGTELLRKSVNEANKRK
ncbi:hypothetical protein NAD41_000890 [Salmonella enterica]|nr:hypothetical protein [Salmonella enterica]EKK6596274.1 hypothetical protein [Salmonella enterica]